jgi:hypothetical protein
MNMENKITAVEWLASELHGHLGPSNGPELLAIFNQAKAMEKEQIIDAASDHCYPTRELARIDAEQYYNETYGSKTES